MAPKVDDVFKQALEMPASDRAMLAERLIVSLEPEPEPDVDLELAWQEEVARRLREVRAGEARMVPWEELRQKLREKTRATG